MIVVIEGMDRCGKDTLIKHLRKTYFKSPKTTMMHCVSPPKDSPEEWSRAHYTHLLSEVDRMARNNWNVILNRSHLGEDVYGPIYRNQKAPWVYSLDEQYLDQMDTILITLIDSPERVLDREDGNSLSDNTADIEMVRKAFTGVYNRSRIPNKVLYDYSEQSDQSLEAMLNQITKDVQHVGGTLQ